MAGTRLRRQEKKGGKDQKNTMKTVMAGKEKCELEESNDNSRRQEQRAAQRLTELVEKGGKLSLA